MNSYSKTGRAAESRERAAGRTPPRAQLSPRTPTRATSVTDAQRPQTSCRGHARPRARAAGERAGCRRSAAAAAAAAAITAAAAAAAVLLLLLGWVRAEGHRAAEGQGRRHAHAFEGAAHLSCRSVSTISARNLSGSARPRSELGSRGPKRHA